MKTPMLPIVSAPEKLQISHGRGAPCLIIKDTEEKALIFLMPHKKVHPMKGRENGV